MHIGIGQLEFIRGCSPPEVDLVPRFTDLLHLVPWVYPHDSHRSMMLALRSPATGFGTTLAFRGRVARTRRYSVDGTGGRG
jgi:hypothetical protein